jgi:hypothetical protein
MFFKFFLEQVLSLDKCIFGIVYPQRHLVAVFEALAVQRRRGKQCRGKKEKQAIVFAHVFPAKITVLQDIIRSERALFSPEEISL